MTHRFGREESVFNNGDEDVEDSVDEECNEGVEVDTTDRRMTLQRASGT